MLFHRYEARNFCVRNGSSLARLETEAQHSNVLRQLFTNSDVIRAMTTIDPTSDLNRREKSIWVHLTRSKWKWMNGKGNASGWVQFMFLFSFLFSTYCIYTQYFNCIRCASKNYSNSRLFAVLQFRTVYIVVWLAWLKLETMVFRLVSSCVFPSMVTNKMRLVSTSIRN